MQIAWSRRRNCLTASLRPLSPLVYLPKLKSFVLFGGDHLDYLTNDTWVFSVHPYRWEMKHPKSAPTPRANHTLALDGAGLVTLSGGYTYSNNTDYTGGQYIDIKDGSWSGDVAGPSWKNAESAGAAAGVRVYRSGPFHPDYFLEEEKPDASKFGAFLKDLPANTWTKTHSPRLPRLNRDWGTAVLDTDRDLILRGRAGMWRMGGRMCCSIIAHQSLGIVLSNRVSAGAALFEYFLSAGREFQPAGLGLPGILIRVTRLIRSPGR